ncbi:MAG: zinc-ribbon domain-containing protein [Oscillospiraceae bacterium]|nr:zinc-ribbon domain-containing protein [Oscillospiraceae bacterium]
MSTEARSYIGDTIGQLTIIEELDPHITPNGSKQRIVKCICSCGNVFTSRLTAVLKSQKCRECQGKALRVDVTGQRFGHLIVQSMADDYISPSGHRLSQCNCLCDCGKTVVVNMSSLVTGKTQSCGCMRNTQGLLKESPELLLKYDYEKNLALGVDIDSLTARTDKKVWWKCSECGNSWFATVASQNDRKKHGCPYCSGRLAIKGKTDLGTQYPEIAREWDYDKNGELDPCEVSSKSNLKVWWKCSEGHEWKATVANRTHNNSGCPRCNLENTNSFCEQAVYYYIKKAFPDAINSDRHLGVELDVFIPSIKTAVEYDGEAWHNSERRKKNDIHKNCLCADAGIKLIRIREPRLSVIDNCISLMREDSISNRSLGKVISELLCYLGKNTIQVNIDFDSASILALYAAKKHENSLAYCHPELAEEWHPTKNGYLTPDRISKASRRTVWWLGKCGHEWQSAPNYRCRRKQCPICYNENRSPAVICVETGRVFESGLDAAKSLGYKNGSSIYRCCRGQSKTAHGYHWIFAAN